MGFILKLLNIFFAVFLINLPVFGATISGNVRQDEILNNKNVVIDSMTENRLKAQIFLFRIIIFKPKPILSGVLN